MTRTVRWLEIGGALALLMLSQGCGSKKPPPPPPSDNGGPHVVTDLSTISPANPLDPFGKQKSDAAGAVVRSAEAAATRGNVEAMGTERHVGDDKHPGVERLLNKKAAQFDMLSMRVMDQLFTAMESLEDDDPIDRLKLPTGLRPVIVTATLDNKGKLRDILLEQHSGEAAVDKMVVQACKRGLYIHNPPADALAPDGTYKIRLETRLENYASMDGETWEFKTYLGMAIL